MRHILSLFDQVYYSFYKFDILVDVLKNSEKIGHGKSAVWTMTLFFSWQVLFVIELILRLLDPVNLQLFNNLFFILLIMFGSYGIMYFLYRRNKKFEVIISKYENETGSQKTRRIVATCTFMAISVFSLTNFLSHR